MPENDYAEQEFDRIHALALAKLPAAGGSYERAFVAAVKEYESVWTKLRSAAGLDCGDGGVVLERQNRTSGQMVLVYRRPPA